MHKNFLRAIGFAHICALMGLEQSIETLESQIRAFEAALQCGWLPVAYGIATVYWQAKSLSLCRQQLQSCRNERLISIP
jgi:hypothetical protein